MDKVAPCPRMVGMLVHGLDTPRPVVEEGDVMGVGSRGCWLLRMPSGLHWAVGVLRSGIGSRYGPHCHLS